MTSKGKIAIIGAGPAGLMAAEQLAQRGYLVTIYDQMPTPARKLLIAGRGGLNLTHSEPLEVFITRYGAAADWLAPSLYAFTPDDVRAWCEGLGQETYIGSSGRVFPRSMKAVLLLRSWLRRLESLGVRYVARHRWLGFAGNELLFASPAGEVRVQADATLLALGGASWPRLGSDGGWVNILSDVGVALSPLRPANCGFVTHWSDYFSQRFAGQPLKPVAISHAGVTRQGEAIITQNGLEGGVVYALSALLRADIEQEGAASVTLDLRPAMSHSELTRKLQLPRANDSFSTYLRKVGFAPLAVALLRELSQATDLTSLSAEQLAAHVKSLPLMFSNTTGMARAISSAGGILHEAVDEAFMLHAKPSVFVAGEMLDWEAPTGGYLLQACFSTAFVAAKGIDDYLMRVA